MSNNINNPVKLYVGTYAKYNNGSINGAWLDLSDYADSEEFYAACKELHKDEEDPEFMFQDYEGFPESLYSESGNVDEIYKYLDAVLEHGQSKIDAFIACFSFEDLGHFQESFRGSYDSEKDFAYEEIELNHNLKGICATYFDYESFARDLFMDGYTFHEGYVFSDF